VFETFAAAVQEGLGVLIPVWVFAEVKVEVDHFVRHRSYYKYLSGRV